MTIPEIVTTVLAVSSFVTALSVLWAKIIHPIKTEIKKIDDNAKQIQQIEDRITKISIDNAEEISFETQIRAVLIEALIAVLDGLEQVGANHSVTEQKKKLITFLSKQMGGKKF